MLYQLGFLLLGLMGLVGLAVSLMWIIHIVIYMLPPVPIHPMLNEVRGGEEVFACALQAALGGWGAALERGTL